MANNTADLDWVDCNALRRDAETGGNRGRIGDADSVNDNEWQPRDLRLIEPDGSERSIAAMFGDASAISPGRDENIAGTGPDEIAEKQRKAEEAAKVDAAKAEARAIREAEEKAKQEAIAAAEKKAREEAEAKAAAEEKARKAAEEQARKDAEAKAKAEAEAKKKAEAEAKAKQEAEEKARKEAEAKAKAEAERKAKEEAEAKAKAEAAARKKAEEQAKAKREAEEKARKEAEAKAKKEAEEKARKEAEARAKAEAERKAKEEAEKKAKAVAAAKAKQEAEAKAKREAEEKARQAAEAKAKKEAEAKARKEAEAKAAAEKQAKEEAARKAEEEAKAKAAAEKKARDEAKAKAQAEKEAKEKAEAEAKAKAKAEREAKAAAAKKAKEEAEAKAAAEAEELARAEALKVDLGQMFRRLIRENGPISLAQYMGESNARYYASRDPLGDEGDFITAPEISQMFGELVGLWLADVWVKMGASDNIHYVELGPGRGTLAKDVLKTAGKYGFNPQVHFVEGSRELRKIQRQAVPHVRFHDDLSTVPEDRPVLIVANEFFDALPIHQLVRSANGWHERMIGLEGDDLAFVAGDKPMDSIVPTSWRSASQGAMIETSPASAAVMTEISQRLANQGGVALIIDYGPTELRAGSTLQALKDHTKVDPLTHPGEADLTAHVDFEMLQEIAEKNGAEVMGLQMQGEWLRQLHIETRLEALQRQSPKMKDVLQRQHDRLVDDDKMGVLFKVLGLSGRRWPQGEGFD